MRSWLFPPTRAAEASAAQVIATGAGPGIAGVDPIDGDRGYRPAGQTGRAVPAWTTEAARTHAVAGYRSNPMTRAIVDTYTSFCVGDSGISLQATNPQVRQVAEEFWNDPKVRLPALQDLMLRDQILTGEQVLELMAGPVSGAVRFAPVDPIAVEDVTLTAGNPLWPERLWIRQAGADMRSLDVMQVDDQTGLRAGAAVFWAPWRTLLTDVRGLSFLAPILDWLDSYDTILSNLIDRTALARYLVWDVTVEGTQADVDAFVNARGGRQIPPSGSVEVHNDKVKWETRQAQTGAFEDTAAAKNVLTLVAGGAGLAKTWLADPEDSNRATSLTMAEPVRRRVGGVQKVWLDQMTELVRFAIDRAVAAKRLPETVEAADPKTGATYEIPAAMSVTVTGPEVAAADAQITAQVLLNLSTGLEKLVATGALSREAAAVAARKGWEDFMGIPYTADLDSPDANPDDVATAVDDAPPTKSRLRPVTNA